MYIRELIPVVMNLTPLQLIYSTFTHEENEYSCESRPDNRDKIVILGSGPNRIGQGIEFDYCCVQAVKSFKIWDIKRL